MPDSSRFNALISMTLALATALLGWFAFKDRLGSPRPPDLRSDALVPVSEQDVVARLWEDPLQAIQGESLRGDPNATTYHARSLAAAITSRLKQGRVGILVVPVPGTPFPDDAETRLRLRYGVQMALAQGGLSPDDRNHLGRLDLDAPGADGVHVASPSDSGAEGFAGERFASYRIISTNRVRVPYEWFGTRSTTDALQLLTLWLPEELLSREPLCRLAHLRSILVTDAAAQSNFAGLFVVGPRSSDTLKGIAEMQESFPTSDHICVGLLSKQLRFYSSQATAPDALIGLQPAANWAAARSDLAAKLSRRFPGTEPWTYFRNFIAPDDQLTDLLARELSLRGVDLKQDRILILAEADTSYGRSLPLAFAASVAELCETNCSLYQLPASRTAQRLLNLVANSTAPANLTFVRYLRGLDRNKGTDTGGPGPKKRGIGTPEETLAAALSRAAEMPQGESQLDYIERLTRGIEDDNTRRSVKAVGILGGDVYDKLILLQAMRRSLPGAVFFTTDLDARLWHPNHLPNTRNLVVASAYGVTAPLTGESGFQMAPFRDCYQAALFQACLAAIQDARRAGGAKTALPFPTVYELGRHGPVQLERPITPGANSDPAVSAWGSLLVLLRILLEPNWRGLCLIMLALVGTGVSLHFYGQRHPNEKGLRFADLWRARTAWSGFVLGGFLLLVGGLAWLVTWSRLRPGGEPWAWGAGVSVWPTEMVRLLTITLVLWMFLQIWRVFIQERESLWDRFFAKDKQDDTYRRFKREESGHPILQELSAPWPEPQTSHTIEQSSATVEARAVFLAYVRKSGLRLRLFRSGIGAFLYLLLAFGIMHLAGGIPTRPIVRGDVARTLDVVVMYVSVGGFILLVFYMLDAVRLAGEVLHRLAAPHTIWPDRLLDKLAPERGVGRDDLEGFLDVQFAAEKTGETGKLIYLPFIIQFLMLISRNGYFDGWNWPPNLVFIFVCNVLLTVTGWFLLRRAARTIRAEALRKLDEKLVRARLELDREQNTTTTRKPPAGTSPSASSMENPAGAPRQKEASVTEPQPLSPKRRITGLERLREQIEAERRGAYARLIQDPALLAVLVPTGLLGIITILFRALFSGM